MHDDNVSEANDRTSYYGINGVPAAAIDGIVPGDNYCGGCGDWGVAGGGYEGGPYGFNQSVIDYAAAIPSPFEVKLTSVVSPTFDTISVRMVVRAKQAFTGSASGLKARIAVVEELISWDQAPGSNGETEFYNVMKKHLPSSSGTALQETWADGDSIVINESWAFGVSPWNVYDVSQLAVVAFVQDDNANGSFPAKTVHQAEFSKPNFTLENSNDATATSLSKNDEVVCGTSYGPIVEISNLGSNALQSAVINYTINGGAVNTYNWTGNLASFQKEDVQLPAVTFTPTGSTNTIDVYTSLPNGATDEGPSNDAADQFSFTEADAADNTSMTVEILTDAYGSEISCEILDGWGNIMTSGSGYGNSTLYTENVSLTYNDCYDLVVYDSYGDGILSGGYVKLIHDAGDLINIAGSSYTSDATVPFLVNVGAVNGIEDNVSNYISTEIYPNPNGGSFNLELATNVEDTYSIVITNMLGQTVYVETVSTAGSITKSIDLSNNEKGVYFVTVKGSELETVSKVVIK